MSYQTRERYPVGVVALREIPAAAQLADLLREHLAEQPAALILDLSELRDPTAAVQPVREGLAAAVLPGAAPVVVLAPRLPHAALPGLVGDPDSALQLARDQPTPHRRTLTGLPPEPGQLRAIRQVVAEVCQEWGIPDTASAAQLVASELLSNTIEHAGTTADVTLALRDNHVHIVVRDRSPALPERPTDPTPNDARGRGLVLIDELAVGLAAVRTESGKLVWAVLAVEPADAPATPLSLADNCR